MNPSSLETAVRLTMDDLGLPYEIEPIIETTSGKFYHFDFRVGDTYIEVDGEFVHSLPGRSRVRRNKKSLITRRHLRLVVLTEADIRAGRTEQILITFLEVSHETVSTFR